MPRISKQAPKLELKGDFKKEIGAKIRAARLEIGLTQRKVAQELGCTQQFVQAIEAGKSDVKFSTFLRLLTILDKKVSQFLDETRRDCSAAAKALDKAIQCGAITDGQAVHLQKFFKEFVELSGNESVGLSVDRNLTALSCKVSPPVPEI